MSNHLHGGILFPTNSKYLNPFRQCKLSRDFAMDGEYTAITFTSIFNLRTQCDPRVRRGIPKGGRRQPPFGCHRQRDITSNRGFKSLKSSHQNIIYKRCIIKLTHSKLRFARQQAVRLQNMSKLCAYKLKRNYDYSTTTCLNRANVRMLSSAIITS